MNQDTTSFNLGERRAGLSDSVRLTLDDLKEAIVVDGDIPGGVRMERRNPNRGMIQSSGVSPTSLSVLTPSRTAGFFWRPAAPAGNPASKKCPAPINPPGGRVCASRFLPRIAVRSDFDH